MKLKEIMELKVIEKLLLSLKSAQGISTAIVDTNRNIVIDAGWIDVYDKFNTDENSLSMEIRNSNRDRYIDSSLNLERFIYEYDSGIVDCSIPIIIENKTIAYLSVGQFTYCKPDIETLRNEAIKYGFEIDDFIESVYSLDIISLDELQKLLVFLKGLVDTIAELGLAQYHLENTIDEVRIARMQAEMANESKSIFFARMSHEIRTPMNAIIGLSRLMEQSELNDVQQNYVNLISRSSTSLLGIINDILDFSKLDVGKIKLVNREFNLIACMEEVVELMSFQRADKDIELNLEISPDSPIKIVSDELRLKQIITNIVGNAFKFTEYGNVFIKVEPSSWVDESVVISITITDTGIGMSRDQVKNLFKPYEQGDQYITRKFGGTGLGLNITKQLIDMFNGSIDVSSTEGQGTTFVVNVPVTAKTQSSNSVKGMIPLKAIVDISVLVVDDNEIALDVMKNQLEGIGVHVITTKSPKDGLQLLEDNSFDLVFVDYLMPEMTGFDLLNIMENRQLLSNTKAVLISAYMSNETRELAQTLNIMDILTKPILPSKLYNTVLEAVEASDVLIFGEREALNRKYDFDKKKSTCC